MTFFLKEPQVVSMTCLFYEFTNLHEPPTSPVVSLTTNMSAPSPPSVYVTWPCSSVSASVAVTVSTVLGQRASSERRAWYSCRREDVVREENSFKGSCLHWAKRKRNIHFALKRDTTEFFED